LEGIRLAVLDMDGTLLEERSSWTKIHQHFGTTEVGLMGFEQFERGLIDYDQFMEQDVAAWPSGTRISEIDSVLSDYTLRRDAKETVDRLRRSARVVMVSAGLDVLARRVALDLGIEDWVANTLRTDGDGRLLGGGTSNVDPSRKELVFEEILSKFSFDRRESMAVGDSVYDLSILRAARVGFFLVGHEPAPNGGGIIPIRSLSEIFDHELLRGF
jgi:phosphoserine phosphatase